MPQVGRSGERGVEVFFKCSYLSLGPIMSGSLENGFKDRWVMDGGKGII